MHIPANVVVQQVQLTLGSGRSRQDHGIVVVYGVHDHLTAPVDSDMATFCNQPWQEFFTRTGVTETDLWFPGSVSSYHSNTGSQAV